MAWNYKREESQFSLVPAGDHRIRIAQAEKAYSKSGREMLSLQFDVSGMKQKLFHYIVFLEDRPEITNRMLTQFFDAFPGIPDGDFNTAHWVGKVGACRVRHEESDYNGGSIQARIHYFIRADKQNELAPWQEPPKDVANSNALKEDYVILSGEDSDGFAEIEGLPLF